MKYAKFCEMPLSSIQPEGWLRRYLEVQRDGLTGHLEVAGYPFDGPGWGGAEIKGHQGSHWWPYEQTGYWIDGMIRCGRLLGDRFLIDKAKHHIDYVLDHADSDGYLGPKFMRNSGKDEANNRWPHAVFFRAMMTEYSATGDEKIPKALARHYLSPGCDHSFARDVCNVEAMVWAYEKTGDKRLLQLAIEAFDGHNKTHPDSDASVRTLLSPKRALEHGVTYNEIGKLGAVLYLHTGNRKFLRATINGYKKIDRDHMLIDGVCSSTEGLAGNDALASHETCDIAEHPWGLGYLLMATGEARYADQIEKAVFNAAPGAVKSDDFKALQYFSCPNQVVADDTSNHNFYFRGANWMAYRPNPAVQCCPGEVNRIMPNYAGRMWMSDGRGGIVAALYGPSVLNTRIDSQDVAIVQETQYPFSEHIDFTIRTAGGDTARRPSLAAASGGVGQGWPPPTTEGTHPPVKFALHVRIPAWCKRAQISVNGRRLVRKFAPGTFVKIARTFAHNDRVSLLLPMEIEVSHWPDGGIGITRGPLVYALRIEEDWQDAHDPKLPPDFPAWKVYPKSDWNYALCVNEKNANEAIEVVHRPLSSHPWSVAEAPIELRVPARKVAGWKILRTRRVFRHDNLTFPGKGDVEFYLKGDFRQTPPLPEPKSLPGRLAKKVETVTLIPYGCTHLRIAIFPQAKTR